MIKHSGDVVPLDQSKRLLKTLPKQKPPVSRSETAPVGWDPMHPDYQWEQKFSDAGMTDNALYFAYDQLGMDIDALIEDAQQLGEHEMAAALANARRELKALFHK